MSLDAIYQYFSEYRRATSDFEVFSQRGSEPPDDDVAIFERGIGFRLPDDFRQFSMSYLGGLYMVAKESIWPAPKAGDVGPFWSFLRGLIVFGLSKEAPEEASMQKRLAEHRKDFGETGLVPFMKLFGSADRFCFDSAGRVLEFYHDEVDAPKVVAPSFSQLLIHEIRELEARTKRKKEA